MTKLVLVMFASLMASANLNCLAQTESQSQPNILLIVADDMGYSDIGCFGGEIDTPTIDRLASEGVRFTNFFVNPMCVVTRTSLLTGHEHSQSNHYRHSLPIARVLEQAGYRTSISGKWHQPKNPLDWGFGTFYGFLAGEINGWKGTYTDGTTLAIQTDRENPAAVPQDWYCTDAFTDHAIAQVDKALEADSPFFVYLPFNAPHGPLHAPQENVEKYYGRFDDGWDVLRQQRMQRMRSMGLIDERYQSNQPEAEVCVWEELPKSVKELESRRFCAYAGMVDRMDQNIGRMISHLEENDVLNNTIVIFFSDNGGNYSHGSIHDYKHEVPWSASGPRPACATGWARLMNSPFSWYKTSSFRGGVSSPLIIRWPNKKTLQPGSILKQLIHVSDLYPTLLEIVGKTYPDQDGERKLKPLYGSSIIPVLNDPFKSEFAVREEIFWGFENTTKGLLDHNWKITSINDSPWKLYNLASDPAESIDLASDHPAKVAELNQRWYQFANEQTEMDNSWKRRLRNDWQGWGLHRVQMTMPVTEISPACSALDVPLHTSLDMSFSGKISFANSEGKTIRLYSVDQPQSPVWQASPTESHSATGNTKISFSLPELRPATTYYLLSDNGWINVGGRPAMGLNDGAYFYRFRTVESSNSR
jgi:arylsulfatase